MKKLITILLLASSFFANSQECTSDTSLKGPGFVPAVLPAAIVEVPYSEDVTIRIIKDSMVVFNGFPVLATFDSIVLNDVEGLPPSFDYNCSNPNCSFVSDTGRCVKLFGNPKVGDEGVYPLTFYVTAYVKVLGINVPQSDTLSIYSITVSDDPNAGLKLIKTEDVMLFPNPSKGIVNFKTFVTVERIKIYSLTGQELINQGFDATIDVSALTDGVYTVQLITNDGTVIRKKLMVNKM